MSPRYAGARIGPEAGDPRVFTVTELARAVNQTLVDTIPYVAVQGEISGWSPPQPSGHIYFTLKDEGAQIRVALFKTRVRREHGLLRDGIRAQVEGALDFYAKQGSLSLVAERVHAIGDGPLQARFEALKRRLEEEGLFRPERKRPLPRYPSHVGLVTSATGAAIRDLLRILRQRAPYLAITLAPTAVQGPGASRAIAAAIELQNAWGRADVLIVGRGGGSLEDLWAFNEEPLVRAIAASRIPVIAAVGHESDVTLADLAADHRAATPSHAAQMVVRTHEELCRALESLSKHARERLRRELREASAHLAAVRDHHALREPARRIRDGRREMDDLAAGLGRGLSAWVLQRRRGVEGLRGTLEAHSPARSLGRARERVDALAHRARRSTHAELARRREIVHAGAGLLRSFDYHNVLRRGYALVWAEGRLAPRGKALRPEQSVRIQFHDARATARIQGVEPEREETP